jgi:hypothetical protein
VLGGQNRVEINENTKQHGYGTIYSKIIAEDNYKTYHGWRWAPTT